MKTERKEFNYGPAIFLITYQTLLLIALPIYFYYATLHLSTILLAIVLLYLTGLSITGGYHRLYSHRAYKTHPAIEAIILFFATMSGQGSALRWSFDHRLHHAYVDTDNDPYSIKKGFWYAHFGWILEKPRVIDPKVVPDLMKNPLVMFQHRHYNLLMVGTNIFAFLVTAPLLNDYWGAFIIVWWLRLFTLHHFTWFINSLAHTWGDKPFCQEQTAVDNFFLSMLTFGEGYHNYHHTFANDYRNGIRWFHFDPTKWLIWTLHKLGLAHNLKQVDPLTIKKRMVAERKTLLIDQITSAWSSKKEELEANVNEISERIVQKISEFIKLKEQYRSIKKQKSEKDMIYEIRNELKRLKKSIREDWKRWKELSRTIMNVKPQMMNLPA